MSTQTKRTLTSEENKELANAIKNNKNEIAKRIIDIMLNIDEIIQYGENALFLSSNNYEIVKYLIELGANINQQNIYRSTPLFVTLSLEIMKLLVEAGANLNHINEHGETVLSIACFKGDLEKVKYLISVGADVNARNGFAFFGAIYARNKFEICKVLIGAGINVNYTNEYGYTPLHKACSNADLDIIELLLDNGADQTIKDIDEKTPIENVSGYGYDDEEIIEFMRNYNSSKFILK